MKVKYTPTTKNISAFSNCESINNIVLVHTTEAVEEHANNKNNTFAKACCSA